MEYGRLSAMVVKIKIIYFIYLFFLRQILNLLKICLQILKFKVHVTKTKLNYKMYNKVLYIIIIMSA